MTQTVPLSILLKADGSQAVGELRKVSGEAKSTTAALTDMGSAPVQNVVVPLRQTALAATGLANASGSAAQHVTQLGYQFNDIAMMLAAGQNPFMLMMQQGTQVNQVFGTMRASGLSVSGALRAALIGMVSPANLATMAVIGLGAAAVQYFTDAGEKAKTLGETMGDLEKASRNLSGAMSEAKLSIWDLRKEFGDGATAAREMNLALLDLARIESLEKLSDAAIKIRSEMSGLTSQVELYESVLLRVPTSVSELNAQLGLSASISRNLKDTYGLSADAAIQASNAIRLMGDTSNIDGVVAGSRQLVAVLSQAKDESGSIPAGLRETAKAAAQAAIEALKLQGNTKEADRIAKLFASNPMADPITAANTAARLLVGNLASAVEMQNALNRASANGGQSSGRGDGMAEWRRRQADQQGSGQVIVADRSSDMGQQIDKILNPDTGRASASAAEKATARDAESVQDLIQSKRDELAILRATNPVQAELLRNREALAAATPKQRAELEQLIISYEQESDELNSLRQANAEVEASFREGFVGLITGADSFGDALGRLASRMADMAANSLFDSLWAGTGGSGGIGSFVTGLFGGTIFGHADGGQVVGAGGPREDNLLRWLSNGEYVVNAASTRENLPLIEAINAGADRKQLMTMILGGAAPRLADGGRVGSVSFAPAPALLRSAQGGDAAAASRSLTVNANIDVSGAQGDSQILAVVQRGVDMAIQQALSQYDREVLPTRINEVSNDPRRIG